jgi:hypothetical protein
VVLDGGPSPAEDAELAKRSAEVDCALRIVSMTAADTSLPIELRARAHYLAGNLEFLRREYKQAVSSYDLSLKLIPGLPEDAGDGIGRDAAYNRAIALRRIEDQQKDAGPDAQPDASPDGGDEPPEGGADSGPPDAGDQQPDAGNDGGKGQDSPDAGNEPDAGNDGGQPDEPEKDKKKEQPPPNQDERLLDLLEHAPTFQEHNAKRAAGRGRATMEDK